MNWRRVVGSVLCLTFLLVSIAESAEEKRAVIRLVPVAPKAVYRPGDSIILELRCPTLKTEVVVLFNPGEGKEGGIEEPLQRCPYSRFDLKVPRDFIGTGNVSVLIRHDGQLQGDMWDFEVRSDRRPKELWMWDLSSSREAPFGYDKCPTFYYAPGRPPLSLNIYAIMPDGVRLDLCGEGVATVRTEPAGDFPFAVQNGSCTVTPRRAGWFRATASFNGVTKSWVCSVEADDLLAQKSPAPQIIVEQGSPLPPRAIDERDVATLPRVLPNPGAPMTAGEFLANPMRLRSHPTDVGGCRLLEHWTSGYCYVYSMRGGAKVSERTDARCGEMAELRRRMKTAIEAGHCGDLGTRGRSPAADPRGTTPQGPVASSLGQNRAHFRNTMSAMRALATAVEAYAVEYDGYPVVGDLRTLMNLIEPRFLPQGKAPRIDAWGTPYVFLCDGNSYRVVSAGADTTFEPNSAKLDSPTAGRTNDAARDLIYSNGHFVQWPE